MSTELTRSSRAFLTARWQHLVLVNYAVEPELLAPHLPPGLELDLLEGKPHVSLVAFDFLDTRVLGVPWPGYRDFPEVNLRFYVRDGDTRGVAFIREYVPRRLIAAIARWLYNEPYSYAAMRSEVVAGPDALTVSHWLDSGGHTGHLQVVADPESQVPAEDSEAHFFKEHSWGYGTARNGSRVAYEVRHPVWASYPVRDMTLEWDWAGIYGPQWAHLADQAPRSVFLAHGSEVSVSPKQD